MKSLIIIGIIIILLQILNRIISKKENKTPKESITKYPYEKTYLLTKAEYAFYRILKNKCDNSNMIICTKVRLEDFIKVTEKQQYMKYRGYIKSRHVDFLICDDKLNIKFGIELDDNSHNNSETKRIDEFKDNLFKKITIPLYRVKMSNGMYEKEIDSIINKINSIENNILPIESSNNL